MSTKKHKTMETNDDSEAANELGRLRQKYPLLKRLKNCDPLRSSILGSCKSGCYASLDLVYDFAIEKLQFQTTKNGVITGSYGNLTAAVQAYCQQKTIITHEHVFYPARP